MSWPSPISGGILGTVTNDNAGPGKVGEYFVSFISAASSIPLSTGVTVWSFDELQRSYFRNFQILFDIRSGSRGWSNRAKP